MHLLLIRHGETEHNVAGLLAGVTDSRLTSHGYLQAERLGKALADTPGLCFTHIFASTLQRAWMTAESVQKHQARRQLRQDNSSHHRSVPHVVQSDLLLEQDFGSLELVKWSDQVKQQFSMPDSDTPASTAPGFKPCETAEAMRQRAHAFIGQHLVPLVLSEGNGEDEAKAKAKTNVNTDKVVVAVVSHGLFLKHLWKNLSSRFGPRSVSLGPEVILPTIDGYQPSFIEAARWANTAYLECTIRPHPSASSNTSPDDNTNLLHSHNLRVLAINKSDHLNDLKRDGVGSSPYDCKQQSIKAFFTKQKD